MEVYAAGVLQDSVKFNHALRHHSQVGHHVVVAEEGAHGLEEVGELTGGVGYKILIGALRFKTPVPGVLEGGNLGGGLLACLFLEEDVVVGVGVEGRVKIDEVNAGVGDVVAQDVEVVAEVELVLPVGGGHWIACLDVLGGSIAGDLSAKAQRRDGTKTSERGPTWCRGSAFRCGPSPPRPAHRPGRPLVQGVPLVARPDARGAGDTHVTEDVAVNDADVAELAALDFGIASGLTVLADLADADVAVGGRADTIPFLWEWRQGSVVRDFAGCGKRAFLRGPDVGPLSALRLRSTNTLIKAHSRLTHLW